MKLHLSASQWLSGLWNGHVHRWWRSSPSWEPLRKRGLGHRRQTPAGRARCPACRHLLTRLPGRDGSGAQRTQFSIKDAALHASCRRLASIVVPTEPPPTVHSLSSIAPRSHSPRLLPTSTPSTPSPLARCPSGASTSSPLRWQRRYSCGARPPWRLRRIEMARPAASPWPRASRTFRRGALARPRFPFPLQNCPAPCGTRGTTSPACDRGYSLISTAPTRR